MPAVKRTESVRYIGESFQSKKGYIVVDKYAAPAAAANTGVLAAQTLPTSGTLVVTTGITNPGVARTLRLKGNQASTQGLVVTIVGTDIRGGALSEAVTMGGAFATPTDTLNAFATVTSVTFPTRGGASDTISIGVGVALGRSRIMVADKGLSGTANNVYEATKPTFGTDTTIGKNLVTFNTAPDGAKNFESVYVSTELYAGVN